MSQNSEFISSFESCAEEERDEQISQAQPVRTSDLEGIVATVNSDSYTHEQGINDTLLDSADHVASVSTDVPVTGQNGQSLQKQTDAEQKITKEKRFSLKKATDEDDKKVKRLGYWSLITRRFARRKSAMVGVVLLLILVFFALFGKFFTKYNYIDPDFSSLSAPPSAEHFLGTNTAGIDLYVLVVQGLGKSLLIGLSVSILTTIFAAIIGTAIAFFEGAFERVGMWVLDMLLVVPSFLLIAMIVRTSSATSGWLWLVFGMTIFGWVGYARVLRTMSLSLRERDYVKAAKYMGVHPFIIIIRHLIPNLGSILIINTALGVVGAVNSETALSYLGLGIKPPDTSLGTILQEGAGTTVSAPWIVLAPSIVLIVLTFSMQLIGDGLRDAMDPNSNAGGEV